MVATAEKDGKVARIGGWGGGVIRTMPEFKRFFLSEVFPTFKVLKNNYKWRQNFFIRNELPLELF